jgi:hypothetical protein
MTQERTEQSGEERGRQALLAAIVAGYEQLAADPEAWAEELDERRVWDSTLGDGLPTLTGDDHGRPEPGRSLDDRPEPGERPRAGRDPAGADPQRGPVQQQ